MNSRPSVPTGPSAPALARLSAADRSVLSMRFVEERTQQQMAEELGTTPILTTDRAFGRYRLYGRKSFRILPAVSTRAQARASARS